MSIKENLRKAIQDGENLVKSCQSYAREARGTATAQLFINMARDLNSSLLELKNELSKYCGT